MDAPGESEEGPSIQRLLVAHASHHAMMKDAWLVFEDVVRHAAGYESG